MDVVKTNFKDLFVIQPKILGDSRGYFFEAYNKRSFTNLTGLNPEFVQDNQSRSSHGTLRGLHMQHGSMAQAKLIRVLEGKVLDVVVDMRRNEPTFGKTFSIELSAENKKQLFVPRGFAHGFVVLSENAEFFYKCDNFYDPQSELGIIYNDTELQIDWKLPTEEIKLSSKDSENLSFREVRENLRETTSN